MDPSEWLDVELAGNVLGLDYGEIARAVQADESTLDRWRQGQAPTATYLSRLERLADLVRQPQTELREVAGAGPEPPAHSRPRAEQDGAAVLRTPFGPGETAAIRHVCLPLSSEAHHRDIYVIHVRPVRAFAAPERLRSPLGGPRGVWRGFRSRGY